MNPNDPSGAPKGARPIEEMTANDINQGSAFSMHKLLNDVLKRHSFTTLDELEIQIIEEILQPNSKLIKGYSKNDDETELQVICHDGTVLAMQYMGEGTEISLQIASGYTEEQPKRVLN